MNSTLAVFIIALIATLIGGAVLLVQQIQRSMRSTEQRQQQALAKTVEMVLEQLGRQQQSGDRTSQVMHQRLDSASQAVHQVHQALAKLEEKTAQVAQLSGDIAGLQRILQAPKMRGSLGEIWLAELIAQIIPKDRYTLQYRFKDGEICDAVIMLRDGMLLSIDSKFSLENFVKAADAPEGPERTQLRKLFASDTKKRIDEISRKYVRPDLGTLDFAFMYVPAESVYYHAFIQDEPELQLLAYAFSKKVIPVSPSSFYAHLQVVLFGLRGLEIEQQAHHIHQSLAQLGNELGRIREGYDKLGSHLRHAQQTFDQTDKRMGKLEQQVETLGSEHEVPAAAIPHSTDV